MDEPPVTGETAYQRIFRRNREWSAEVTLADPAFFERRKGAQAPDFLFIGCSDSRVPAELLTGAEPGEMFVHRNVANLAPHNDLNLLSVLQYAIDALEVKAVIVCGHYGCGGVRAAMQAETEHRVDNGLVDHWLWGVREVMRLHGDALSQIADEEQRYRRLIELNAMEQAYAIRRTPIVEKAWARGQELAVHAMVYDLSDGVLHDLHSSYCHTGPLHDAHVSAWMERFSGA